MSNVNYHQPVAHTGGKHPVNILHLVMGVVFLGIVSIWALIEGQVATTEDLRWLVPLPWVIAGAAGLFVIMMSRGNEPAAPAVVYEYAAQPEPVSAPDYTSDLDAKLEAETAAAPEVQPEADPATESDAEETPES